MPTPRRFGTPLAVILLLIALSVFTVITLGEGFKLFSLIRNDDSIHLNKRDTITFNMPWNPPQPAPQPEVKAVSPAVSGILDAVEKVAAALLDGGSDIANLAQGVAGDSTTTILPGAPTLGMALPGSTTARIQDVDSAVDQATGVVGGIVSAATGIVGSLLSGASGGATGLGGGAANASSTRAGVSPITKTVVPVSSAALNSSESTSSLAHNVTSAPVLAGAVLSSSAPTVACPSMPSYAACPAASTETCTVTETWHSTHYESTATLFSFVAAFTVTCTETVSACPVSNLYPLSPPNATSPSPTHPALIACARGVLAKRSEDCPPTSSLSNITTPYSRNASTPSSYSAIASTSSHPCPNAGYSCSECPDGVFCPPSPTAAQDCRCGYGWACGHCSQGWFCVPSPTPGPVSSVVSSAAGVLGNASASGITSAASSVPSTMASFTASRPSSLASLLPIVGVASSTLQAFRSPDRALSQVTGAPSDTTNSASSIINNVMSNVNSALGNVNGLSGAILSSILGEISSAFGVAKSALGNANPTNLAAISGTPGSLLPSATSAVSNILSTVAAAGSNAADGIIPTATSIIGNVASSVISTGVVAVPNAPSGLASTIIVSVPGLNNAPPLFLPTITIPVINNAFPVLAKQAVQPTTVSKDEPNVINHLTTTIQGVPTVFPAVITVLNGKPSALPFVKMVVDGAEKELPVVGADLGGGMEGVKVDAVARILEGGVEARGEEIKVERR